MVTPKLNTSFYVKWAGHKGFGIFLGSESLGAFSVAATYGGVVGTYKDSWDHKQCYTLGSYKLPPFKFRKEDNDAIADGSSVWSGDGKFINHSCCPTLIAHGALDYFGPSKTDPSKYTKILSFYPW